MARLAAIARSWFPLLAMGKRHDDLTKSICYPARNRHELSDLVDRAIEHNCRLSRMDFAAAGSEGGHVA